MRYILAILLPPLAVAMTGRWVQLFLNIVLCFLFWVPAIIHALFVVSDANSERRLREMEKRIKSSNT
ncbi:MAG TPA: YqaE/Pmp3 family membrane protein [Trichocoleus sp.]